MSTLPLTPQAVFDAAWNHFARRDVPPAAQISRSSGGAYVCKYRTFDDRKCAIGLLIPDGHPAQGMTASANELYDSFPKLFAAAPPDFNWSLFQRQLHDGLMDPQTGKWKPTADTSEKRQRAYSAVAAEYNLKVPE